VGDFTKQKTRDQTTIFFRGTKFFSTKKEDTFHKSKRKERSWKSDKFRTKKAKNASFTSQGRKKKPGQINLIFLHDPKDQHPGLGVTSSGRSAPADSGPKRAGQSWGLPQENRWPTGPQGSADWPGEHEERLGPPHQQRPDGG
jgi:hypothetical protein